MGGLRGITTTTQHKQNGFADMDGPGLTDNDGGDDDTLPPPLNNISLKKALLGITYHRRKLCLTVSTYPPRIKSSNQTNLSGTAAPAAAWPRPGAEGCGAEARGQRGMARTVVRNGNLFGRGLRMVAFPMENQQI